MTKLIENAGATGYRIGPVELNTSEQFDELAEFHPPRTHARCHWLIITGTAFRDDFGTSAKGALIVSERILQVLQQGRLQNCDITPL